MPTNSTNSRSEVGRSVVVSENKILSGLVPGPS